MDVAHCGISNPERDSQRVLVKRFQLSLDIEKSHLENEPGIPILRMQSWFDFFLKNSCLHILHGLRQRHDVREKAIMAAFWRNFREVCPNHEIFSTRSRWTSLFRTVHTFTDPWRRRSWAASHCSLCIEHAQSAGVWIWKANRQKEDLDKDGM